MLGLRSDSLCLNSARDHESSSGQITWIFPWQLYAFLVVIPVSKTIKGRLMSCRSFRPSIVKLELNLGLSHSKAHMTTAFKYFRSTYDIYKQQRKKKYFSKAKVVSWKTERFLSGFRKWTNAIWWVDTIKRHILTLLSSSRKISISCCLCIGQHGTCVSRWNQ